MSTVTFLGQEFNTEDLSEPVLNYINTYNSVINGPKGKSPEDRDYQFRMNQALQMFGNEAVVAGIQLIIDTETGGS